MDLMDLISETELKDAVLEVVVLDKDRLKSIDNAAYEQMEDGKITVALVGTFEDKSKDFARPLAMVKDIFKNTIYSDEHFDLVTELLGCAVKTIVPVTYNFDYSLVQVQVEYK